MPYDYNVAKAITTEAEKERFMAIFLNTNNGVTDWEKAAKDHGSASVASMKVSLSNTYKKLEKAGGKLNDDGTLTQASETPIPATPASGKKRKAKGEVTADADAEDGGSSGAPAATPKSKRGRPKKTAVTPKAVEDDPMEEENGEVAEAGGVKKENADDLV